MHNAALAFGDETIATSESLDDAYRRHGATLHATARRVLGNDADASDCVHDVLERVLRRAPAYRPERGALRTYLAVAVRNEALSRIRRARRHAELERLATASEPAAYDLLPADVVDLARLQAALAQLPSEQRTTLALAYRFGLSHTEIAQRQGVPLGTVKSRLVLAMRKLGEALR